MQTNTATKYPTTMYTRDVMDALVAEWDPRSGVVEIVSTHGDIVLIQIEGVHTLKAVKDAMQRKLGILADVLEETL